MANTKRKNGIAVNEDGAVYIVVVANGSQVPSTANPTKGLEPLLGKFVSIDGELYVRFA